jgi:alpha-N-acetylglucosamine transferase
MTDEVLTKLVVNCATGESTVVPLTEEELAQLETDRLAYEEAEAARVAAEEATEALRQSAITKLMAAEPLTAEEAALMVK